MASRLTSKELEEMVDRSLDDSFATLLDAEGSWNFCNFTHWRPHDVDEGVFHDREEWLRVVCAESEGFRTLNVWGRFSNHEYMQKLTHSNKVRTPTCVYVSGGGGGTNSVFLYLFVIISRVRCFFRRIYH